MTLSAPQAINVAADAHKPSIETVTLPRFLIAQTEKYLADLPQRLEDYQTQRFASIEQKLAEKKAEYDSLAEMREDDVAQKFQRIENILRQLESAGCR